jgi:choline dehydrogenase-like flavoprotein
VLGHYFHDHLSAPTARLETTDKKALNRTAGFRFESRGMRSLRFEPSLELRRPENLPAGFAHIGYSTRETSGFEALRVCYRSIQQRGAPTGREVASLAPFIPWLARASWWRLVERRLLFPENPEFDLHMVVEQVPMFRNRIDLSQDRFDRFGAPLARIDWRIGDADVENARLLTAHFVAAWRTSRLASLGRCHTYSAEAIRRGMLAAGGIYHPGGTVRMAASPSRGVVDGTLRTFRIRNLSVLSTAVFPTGGGSNPTMMLLLAALRMAETLR